MKDFPVLNAPTIDRIDTGMSGGICSMMDERSSTFRMMTPPSPTADEDDGVDEDEEDEEDEDEDEGVI